MPDSKPSKYNMKTRFNFLRVAMFVSLCALNPNSMRAASFDLLHSFQGYSATGTNIDYDLTNNDGMTPLGGLAVSGSTLYGTAQSGGPDAVGTVFSLSTSGGNFALLHTFSTLIDDTNYDGAEPMAGLVVSGNQLFGTADVGGVWGAGTLFALNTDGSNFTVLHSFTGLYPDGSGPNSPLTLSSNTLYGTAYFGGDPGSGSVFSVNTDGSDFETIYNFTGLDDGSSPLGGVILSGGVLYGTASYGGAPNFGTVFAVNTDGTGFTLLHSFSIETNTDPNADFPTNSDGAVPESSLILSGNTLYGTTSQGGLYGGGTVFAVNTNGSGFTVLHHFSALGTSLNNAAKNSDGFSPRAGLIVAGSTLYGTAGLGGANAVGTVFSLHTDGSDFVTLTSFTADPLTGGDFPAAPLVLSGTTLYGTSDSGGKGETGTVFDVALGAVQASVPVITIDPSSETAADNSTVTLFVDATGTGKLSYQWWFKNAKIPGATAQDLMLKNVSSANTGDYYATVANSAGVSTSGVATITVLAVPNITAPPASVAAALGGSATFSVKATGSPLTYAWLFDSNPLSDDATISGSASNILKIQLIGATNVGAYSVVVSNSFGASTSQVAVLTLKAEKTKPSVTIAFPKAGSRVGDSSTIVVGEAPAPIMAGTAFDTVRVQAVTYWFTNWNNGVTTITPGVADLSAGSGTSSNWTIPTAPLPGTNILAVQSVNYAGLFSPVAQVSFFYQVVVPLSLRIVPTGTGSVTGAASIKGDPAPADGANLYVGETYTLSAKAGPNWWLTNWWENGVVAGTATNLTFVMEPNLVITANFATNLFAAAAGRYDGIFTPSDSSAPSEADSGLIQNLQLGSNGVYSGKLWLAGVGYSLTGTFNRSGQATETIKRSTALGGSVTLQLTIPWGSVPRQINGSIGTATWSTTNLALYAATTNTNNSPSYTLLVTPSVGAASTTPPGFGYALITNTGSTINMGFFLADGTSFSCSEPINEADSFPVYGNIYGNQGFVLGQLSLDTATASDVPSGQLTWLKPAQAAGFFKAGFNTQILTLGSPWTNSTAAIGALFPNNAQLTVSGGGLNNAIFTTVQLTSSNTLRWVGGSTNFTGGSINPNNGSFSFSFVGASGKKVTAHGALLPDLTQGDGYFLGASSDGTITLLPATSQPASLPDK
jgi:uncharacterized repeat protein (TIGR03803 family)